MITINKEEKRVDIQADYETVLLYVDGTEYKIPMNNGEGCLTNIQEEMNDVWAYGMVKLETA